MSRLHQPMGDFPIEGAAVAEGTSAAASASAAGTKSPSAASSDIFPPQLFTLTIYSTNKYPLTTHFNHFSDIIPVHHLLPIS